MMDDRDIYDIFAEWRNTSEFRPYISKTFDVFNGNITFIFDGFYIQFEMDFNRRTTRMYITGLKYEIEVSTLLDNMKSILVKIDSELRVLFGFSRRW